MPYTRALKYRLPMMRGGDVLQLQLRLIEIGLTIIRQPDGIFGPRTEMAVKTFQESQGLKVDGIVGPLTWTELFQATAQEPSLEKVKSVLEELKQSHQYRNSVLWQLTPKGLVIDSKKPATTVGEPKTVQRIWRNFGASIEKWGSKLGVPVELIIATICTETRGDASAVREEPGFISDSQTPNKVSPGLMQTLISTARETLGDDTIDRSWLKEPENSIRAGTAYIASQWRISNFDPPKVACAYNAGGIYYNNSDYNRWKMRQYPINSGEHADRFIQWFNDCFLLMDKEQINLEVSFFKLMSV